MAAFAYSQLMPSHAYNYRSAGGLGILPESESEQSSIVDISTTMAPSDTDEEEHSCPSEVDTRKYRVPDSGKTRLQVRTNGLALASDITTSHAASDALETHHREPKSPYRGSPRRYTGEHDTSDSDFVGSGISREGSVYSLSRMSFASQLTQLTSIRLPSASTLSVRMSSMQTAQAAARALTDASEQIKKWTKKAGDVLQDLDAKDDAEWAAAGGREGLDDVDQAVTRFEGLVKVYVISVEELHMRKDVSTLSAQEMEGAVAEMETIVKEWQRIKDLLRKVKEQGEIAMEWEELWNNVLGEIGQELDALAGLIFEMEEKRHRTIEYQTFADATKNIDINDLENIVEDKPTIKQVVANPRYSLPPPFSPTSPIESPAKTQNKDDSNLLALFARMQPLRASLDFLPMRLSVFHVRGNTLFPTSVLDLEKRRDTLEDQWKKIESDAEALRKELGEDRWVLVFRNAASQALKMCESVERSHNKLREALNSVKQHADTLNFFKLVESYEAKKMHYVPAVERVLAIIDRGVMDRLTVNGEILRLQSDMKRRWSSLQMSMRELDTRLEDGIAGTYFSHLEGKVSASDCENTWLLIPISGSRNDTLRDSISTILSSERSMGSSTLETPWSSPASSIVLPSREGSFNGSTTPTMNRKLSSSRLSSLRTSLPRKTSTPSRSGANSSRSVSSPLPKVTEPYTGKREPVFRELKDPLDKPRWSSSTVVREHPIRRDSLPRSTSRMNQQRQVSTPISYRSLPPRSEGSFIPLPSPLSHRPTSPSPEQPSQPLTMRKYMRAATSPLAPRSATSLGNRAVSTGSRHDDYRRTTSSQYMRSMTPSGTRKASLLGLPLLTDENDADNESPARSASRLSSRPPSATATPSGRRNSLFRTGSRMGGRDSMMGNHVLDDKPQWRL